MYHADSKYIIPSPFTYSHIWLHIFSPIYFVYTSGLLRIRNTACTFRYVYANMSGCLNIPVGLSFSCYTICLQPPTMHITVMPIGRGAISCNTCLETVMSYCTVTRVLVTLCLHANAQCIKSTQWRKIYLFVCFFPVTKESTSWIDFTLNLKTNAHYYVSIQSFTMF